MDLNKKWSMPKNLYFKKKYIMSTYDLKYRKFY